jgi:hypothetical protein
MTATEWAVSVEAAFDGPLYASAIDDLYDFLAPYGGALAVDDRSIRATLTVSDEAADPFDAACRGRDLLMKGLDQVGLQPRGWLMVEAITADEQDRRLAEPTVPELVGVSEVAQLLNVSRQRASELARAANFPTPVARLASGPVWARMTLDRFVESWNRAPGRRPTQTRPPRTASC